MPDPVIVSMCCTEQGSTLTVSARHGDVDVYVTCAPAATQQPAMGQPAAADGARSAPALGAAEIEPSSSSDQRRSGANADQSAARAYLRSLLMSGPSAGQQHLLHASGKMP